MKLDKYELEDLIAYILGAILIWVCITSAICAFMNPELTQTQIFLRIPQSFILNF